MIVYGRNPVREALRGPRRVRRVWAAGAAAREPWLAEVAAEPADPARLGELCGSPDHQGVCAETEPYAYADPDALLAADDAIVVCLDQVQDPGNLGAVCRTAECAGAAGVVIPDRRAAEVTAAVCRASAGAVEHLPVARVGNLSEYLGRAKESGAWVYGASTRGGVPWTGADLSGRVVLVLGAEGRGLRPRVESMCDERLSLPLRGKVESLNVSAAAAAFLYEILQQRGIRG